MVRHQRRKGSEHMANIMLTYRCNLHCPYCFANEFVNKEKTNISLSNFLKAVSFITANGPETIYLIGGEPTVHPGFGTMMELLAANRNVACVRLFTNGLLLDRFVPQLIHPKVEILVNCNSPLDIGKEAFDRIRRNLDTLIFENGMGERVGLGINLYSDDLDYTYIADLLQRYGQHHLRFSLTVPVFSAGGGTDVLGYFRKRKKYLLEFLRKMDSIGVTPSCDCNRPPYCIWDDEEKEWLEAFNARCKGNGCSLTGGCSWCVPAVDILPDLQAIRCFGMSDFLKVPITQFASVDDLVRYFENEIDSIAYKISLYEECKDCYARKTKRCMTGCIGYKAAGIRACNDAIARM